MGKRSFLKTFQSSAEIAQMPLIQAEISSLQRFAAGRQSSQARIMMKFYRMAHKLEKKIHFLLKIPNGSFPKGHRTAAECWLPFHPTPHPDQKTGIEGKCGGRSGLPGSQNTRTEGKPAATPSSQSSMELAAPGLTTSPKIPGTEGKQPGRAQLQHCWCQGEPQGTKSQPLREPLRWHRQPQG